MKLLSLALIIATLLLFTVSCTSTPDVADNPPVDENETVVNDEIAQPENSEVDEEPEQVDDTPADVEVPDEVPEEESTSEDSDVTESDEPVVEDTPVEDVPVETPKQETPVVAPPTPQQPVVDKKQPLNHNKYWPLQKAYLAAIETNDPDDLIPACEAILSLYVDLEDVDSCKRVISPLLILVKIYEERGQFADALRCYKMYRDAYKFLDANTDENCDEPLKFAEAFINHYAHIEPEVYAVASNPADVPYYGAPLEPRVGAYSGMCGLCDRDLSTGILVYVQFGMENMSTYNYKLPKDGQHYMLELAWNTSTHTVEFFKDIADGKYDDYIKENLNWLASLENCGILLRFGAEVNNWEANSTYAKNGRLEEFKKQYIEAFRRVSNMKKQYAPDVAMVYSPNDISNMNVTHMDFYPGDEYVDWVGLSSYMLLSANATNEWGSMTDAFYCRGKYADQIIKIKPIIDDFGSRKPILISECGFAYYSTKAPQTQAYAEEKMRLFYSYFNMVYPQIKAIYYFNTNFDGDSFQLYDEKGNSVNRSSNVYEQSIHANVPLESLRQGTPEGYTRLETLNEVRDSLTLAVYVSYPGNPTTNVVYTLDGAKVGETSTAPYQITLGKDKLSTGTHTLTVTTTCKLTTFTKNYTITVSTNGNVSVK